MEYAAKTSAGQGPGENTKLIEMGEIGLCQLRTSANHCADDGQEAHVEKCAENQNSGNCVADDNANDLVDASIGDSYSTCALPYSTKKGLAEFTEANYELQQAYRILRDLMSEGLKGVNLPFMDSIETTVEDVEDYYEVITKPMWLKKVRHKFLKREYNNITEFVADVRLILENCYRYNGPDSPFTKKALRLEQMLEQKLALLPRELRDKTTLEITSGKPVNDDIIATRRRSTRHSLDYTSILLHLVRNEKAERNREQKKKITEEKKVEKEEKEKEVLVWEDKLLEEPLKTQMKAMWELPVIGHFFYLCQTVLNMPEVSQFELERILVMPRASSLLPKIMTSLLSNPTQRAGLDRNPPMPYKVWQSRLQNRIQSWYKVYHARENRGDLVFQQLGIEANFFKVLGTQNPLNEKRFHELGFHQKIWCIKGLCDYILYNHRTVQDALNDQLLDDMREYILGRDSDGNTYLHFPQFCGLDLRIYKQMKCNKPPSPGSWGAPCTKKRKLPKSEKILSPPIKKQKTATPKLSVEKVKPSEPTLAQLCTRRSPRFSKSSELLEKITNDEHDSTNDSEEATSEEEQDADESDFDDDDDDDDDDVEPNIAKFELVVDSVESLRTFMNKFKDAYENMHNRKEKQPFSRCEAELYRRLKNLLEELEPWESKLQKSAQRIRNRLRREWEDFVEDEEEIEDIWGSDGESEDRKSASSLSASGSSKDETGSLCERTFSKVERPATRARAIQKIPPVKKEEISTEELLKQDDNSCEYRTRGRLQQLRIMHSLPKKNIKPGREIKINGCRPGQQDLLLTHSMHNTTSQAKELYAWETLRQILVPASNTKSADPQAGSNSHRMDNMNSLHTQGLTENSSGPHLQIPAASPEKQNLIHAKMDMLGAMQAAMAKKPYTTVVTKQPQLNNTKIARKKVPSMKNSHILKAAFQRSGSNLKVLQGQQTKLSSATATPARLVPPFNPTKSLPTKQHLSDISSVAENTKNLKRLLEQVNKVPPSTVISSTISSPAGGESSIQSKAQIMLFPMFDADGKSVVYRVTSNKPLSSIPGMDIKKIALALATSATSSLPPGFIVEKISVDGNLLHGQASNISHDVLADIAFRQTKVTATSSPAVRPSASLPKSPPAKPAVMAMKEQSISTNHNMAISASSINRIKPGKTALPYKAVPGLQSQLNQTTASASLRCVPSTTPNSHIVQKQSVPQQMILVPVQNQHGQTMYLQIPGQAPGVDNSGKLSSPQVKTQSKAVVSIDNQTSLPIPVGKPCDSVMAMQTGILGNSPLASGNSVTPNKVAPSVMQRLIPALSSKRLSSFSSAMLVSEPPPLAPFSKPQTPNSKLAGVQQDGLPVMSGLSPANLQVGLSASNVTNTLKSSIVLQSEQVARTAFSGAFSMGNLTNNSKLPAVGNTVLPAAAINGTTPPKNLISPIKVNEQVAQQQSQHIPAMQTFTRPQTLSAATPSPKLTPLALPTGAVISTNTAVNPGIMSASGVHSANHNNKQNALTQLEFSPDVLSASVASLVAKNPALAATVQKYIQSGHKVMIAQQGNQLVLQAYPPQVNVTVPRVAAAHINTSSEVVMPVKQVQATSSNLESAFLHNKIPTIVPPVQNWAMSNSTVPRVPNNTVSKISSLNIAQTIVRPPTVIQSSAVSSLSCQVGSPSRTINQTSVSSLLQNVVCQTVVSSPSASSVLTNSAMITSNSGSPGHLSRTATTATTQHKLVMIRDTTTDKQTLGILLDNGQVVPLNASISFANAAVS